MAIQGMNTVAARDVSMSAGTKGTKVGAPGSASKSTAPGTAMSKPGGKISGFGSGKPPASTVNSVGGSVAKYAPGSAMSKPGGAIRGFGNGTPHSSTINAVGGMVGKAPVTPGVKTPPRSFDSALKGGKI